MVFLFPLSPSIKLRAFCFSLEPVLLPNSRPDPLGPPAKLLRHRARLTKLLTTLSLALIQISLDFGPLDRLGAGFGYQYLKQH
jgi:hypothetical protein